MNYKAAFAFSIAASLLVASCKPGEPRYVETSAPDWAKDVKVVSVSKRSAVVKNSLGEDVRASQTDIGNGLIATRGKYRLYITDSNGVKCRWGSDEQLSGCEKPNPKFVP